MRTSFSVFLDSTLSKSQSHPSPIAVRSAKRPPPVNSEANDGRLSSIALSLTALSGMLATCAPFPSICFWMTLAVQQWPLKETAVVYKQASRGYHPSNMGLYGSCSRYRPSADSLGNAIAFGGASDDRRLQSLARPSRDLVNSLLIR